MDKGTDSKIMVRPTVNDLRLYASGSVLLVAKSVILLCDFLPLILISKKIIHEHSKPINRCCCAPGHSLFAKFYLAGEGDIDPKEAGLPPVMTMERPGCDCGGPCPKPCLCCCACTEGCSDAATFYAGDINGEPGSKEEIRETAKLIGASQQPITGGKFKPVMQIMDRDGDAGDTSMFAAARGPCLFGGCSEFCNDSRFGLSVATPGMTVDQLHELPFGDFAHITKKKPSTFTGGLREAFTDSDIYEVEFVSKNITPQQKANILASMVHLDYMFFERKFRRNQRVNLCSS